MADSIQLGIRITADGKGAESTINSLNKTIEKTGDATRKAAAGWSALSKAGAEKLQAIESARRLTQGLNEAGLAAQKAARQAQTGAGLINESFGKVSTTAKVAGTAIAGMMAAFSVRSIIEATREMDRLRGMMESASGGAALSAQNLRFVEQTARTLGIGLSAAAEGFANITAAARGTELEGKATRDIFLAVAKASAAMGKSSEDTISMIQALGQMISKGTVSMEELRGQLGDRLPGAFQLAAKAMGMTTQELDKLISSGQVSAVDFLPKLAKALEDTYGNARFDRINNNITRVDNAWTKFKANIIDNDSMSRSLGVVAGALERINGLIDKSKALGGQVTLFGQTSSDIFQTIPSRSQVQQALAGQVSKNPLETIDAEQLNQANAGLSKTAQQYINAANAAWKLTAAQKQVVETIVKIGEAKGFDPAFLLSIAKAETRLGELNRVSSAGAKGVFQFMDGTAKRFGVRDPWNLEQATNGAIKYLGLLKGQFKSVGLAAAGYNAGEGNVQKYGGVPPFKETQTYVKRVLQNMRDLQNAMGKSSDDIGKEIAKADKDQYQSYVDHLKSREAAFDGYAKRQLAEQRTMMERLEAARQETARTDQATMAGGNQTAIRQAEDRQRKFLEDKKALLLQGIQIEEEATRKKIANIGMEIAAAQKTPGMYGNVEKLRRQREAEYAEMAALAERRKQLEISTQSDVSKVASEYEDKRRDAMKRAADDNAAIVEQQRLADEESYRRMQQRMELAMQDAGNVADARKQDIDNQVESARAETAAAEARRQSNREGLTGIEAMQQARVDINASLRDALDLIDLEKQKTLEKLSIDGELLAGQRQLLEVYREIAQQRGDQDAVLAYEKQLNDIYAGQSKNIRDRIKAQSEAAQKAAKAQVDASKTEQGMDSKEVRESQLRLNAFWDQYMGRLNDYANVWREITGETENGFSRMAIAMGEYSKQAAQIGQYFDQNPKAFGDMTGAVEGLQQGQAALAAMAKTMLALRTQYKEGTQGYADMTSAAERMMEVQRALQVVEGVLAVIHQATSGDVYSAIPRMLGVMAMISSLGVNVGAAGGGMSNKQAQNASQAGGSTSAGGGVFGDTSAKSDSINRSLEIVAQNSNADLAYSAGMLRSLKNIELALAGTTNAIIRGVGPAQVNLKGTTPFGMDLESSMMRVVDPIGSMLGLSKITSKITNWGIKALPQALDQIIAQGFQGMNWTEVTKTTKILGITLSKSVKNIYGELDTGVTGQITRVIRSMADTVREAGKAFGISGDQFNSAMSGFVVNFGTLATKGMKSDELEKAVQQVFSSMSDDMAQQFQSRFDLQLEPFMRAGQGMYETLVMVADGINVATGMLAQFGLAAINYKDIIQKQGDVASEIVRQSIVAFEGVFGTIGKYIDGAVGSAEELLAVYADLLSIRAMSALVGLSFRDLSNDMIVAAGGVAALKDSISFYLENFIGLGGVAAAKTNEVNDAFRRLGVRMPETQDAFRQLVDGIDQSTSAGQKLWAQLLKLAPAFLEAKQAVQDLADLRAKLKGGNPFAEMDSQWKQLWKDWGTVMDGELAMVGGPFQAKIKAQQDAIQGWAQAISTGTASIGLLTGELVRLSIAKAPASVLKSVEQAIVTLTKNLSDWQKKIKEATQAIATLEDAQDAATVAKRQEILKEQGWSLIGSIVDMWERMISGIRGAVASMQDQIDQLQPNASQAIYSTAAGRVTDAYANLADYRSRMAGMGQATDPTVELGYLQQLQQAIMARYNAELALLQEAQQAMVAAETERLNAALELQIEAINAATEAAIEAENDRLEAVLKAQDKVNAAEQKALQKQFDAANKAQQKADEAVQKLLNKQFEAEQKVLKKQFEAEQKALQKVHDAQMKALNDELDAANRLRDAIKSVAEYAQSMKLGANSPLSPEQRLNEAQRQYQALLTQGNAGDAEAIGKLAGASDAYLEAARNYYGSSSNYQDIFDGVQQAMESIGGMSAPDPDSIQARIDFLREAQEAQFDALRESQEAKLDELRESQAERMDALRESQQERLDAIREGQQEQMDQVREQQQARLDAIRDASQKIQDQIRQDAQKQIEAAQKVMQQTIADLSDPNKNAAIRELKDRTIAELQAIQEQTRLLEDQARTQALKWEQEIRDWMAEQNVNDAAMLTALDGIKAAITGVPAKASGGLAGPGLTLVGERGPELVNFSRPGQVYTASETRSMMSGGSDEETKTILRDIKTETRASVTVQSTAFSRMIDQLNSLDDRMGAMERNQRLKA